MVSVLVTLFFFFVATAIGFIATTDLTKVEMFTKGKYIGLFFLQIFTQLSFAFLLGLLVRKAFIAYGLFIFYGMIVESMAGAFFKFKIQKFGGVDYGQFLPLEISDRLIPVPIEGWVGANWNRWERTPPTVPKAGRALRCASYAQTTVK